LARALPARLKNGFDWVPALLNSDIKAVSDTFGLHARRSPFGNAGVMQISLDGHAAAAWSSDVVPAYEGAKATLRDVIESEFDVPNQYFVQPENLEAWKRQKGARSLARTSRKTGLPYTYDEGGIPFPDPVAGPSRTILTAEAGTAPSRFKHVIETSSGRFRRLTPRELELLNGFPGDWTVGLSDSRRAFLMGNALVVDLVAQIAKVLANDLRPDQISEGMVASSS
jgi:DNA (cytosine-5)-methyltransferase 1